MKKFASAIRVVTVNLIVLIVLLVFVLDFVGYLTGTRFGVGRPVLALIAAPVEQSLQQLYDRRVRQAPVTGS